MEYHIVLVLDQDDPDHHEQIAPGTKLYSDRLEAIRVGTRIEKKASEKGDSLCMRVIAMEVQDYDYVSGWHDA